MTNKAYGGSTWTNDRRHTWKQWRYGHSSLAADGGDSSDLADCAIMDNYYVETPVFRVEVARANGTDDKSVKVRGVVVVTWQGKGQGELASDRVKKRQMRRRQDPHTKRGGRGSLISF